MARFTDHEYAYVRRPNYEFTAFVVWLLASLGVLGLYLSMSLPVLVYQTMGAVCLSMALGRSMPALQRYLKERQMKGGKAGIDFISWQVIKDKATGRGKRAKGKSSAPGGQVWIGRGFPWRQQEIQKATEIIDNPPEWYQGSEGRWIHGLGDRNNEDLDVPIQELEGHTLIVGSTGTGKTRLFEFMISQAIFRNEPVIVIDPKGDKDLSDNMRLACARMGAANRFLFFHRGFPERSVRLDPLKNWNEPTEVASRVAALIPSETKVDPWWAFGWKALESVIHGMVYLGLKPNLMELRRYVEGGVEDILWLALRKYYADNWPGREIKKTKLDDALREYQQLSAQKPETAVDGLKTMYLHNREHFQKMISSLIPILSMLTAGNMRYLLSPETDDGDPRPALDLSKIIEKNGVLYIGLDCLSDPTVGSAIGSILVAELSAVASARCNREGQTRPGPLNVFVDEAAEVVNDPAVQLLNKSRSAGFRIAIATQTLADLMVRTGTSAGARQVIGNVNNWIVFRVIDGETQKYISEALPQTVVRWVDKGYRSGTRSDDPMQFNSMYTEAVRERPSHLFPPALLGALPTLDYFCKFANGTTWKGRLPIIQF
ncbi:MAG: conjugative transfer system coupling protein TraD [Syntrophobacterales bacterium]|nr:conjugative transfer system coupling protein TraD [Syntrophobacterales bacterium]